MSAAGAAVAHVPLPLRVEVGCAGGLACDELTVTARELRDEGRPRVLAVGIAHVKDGKAAHRSDRSRSIGPARASSRSPSRRPPATPSPRTTGACSPSTSRASACASCTSPAARPTTCARSRSGSSATPRSTSWPSSSFARRPTTCGLAERAGAHPVPRRRALHRAPAELRRRSSSRTSTPQPYGLEKHLKSLARYVREGGGLIMVGGPDSFVRRPLREHAARRGAPGRPPRRARRGRRRHSPPSSRVPHRGRPRRPALRPLRALIGDELPEMPGTNVVGDARPGDVAALEHPTRTTKSGAPMPILALGEHGRRPHHRAQHRRRWHLLLFSAFAAQRRRPRRTARSGTGCSAG